jgi:peptidoglycan/xylan/chitin deacetylase (PgdA/CDA1 family)
MYHDVYDPEDPTVIPDANKVSTTYLKEELKYLVDEGYYFPTWEEVRRYIDGKIDLPEKSIVLTFDDATNGFLKLGIPLLEKYDVHATSFVITSKKGKKVQKILKKNPPNHVEFQSHSHDMHRPGGMIGHGGVMTALSHDEIVEDLKKSQKILGTSEAFAYPFGDYTEECGAAVEDAGYLVAFTTEYGKVFPGVDPMFLPRMRSNGDISLETFKELL